jgi:prepilin-type N-terminal cleavage/methylation domain-containing protein
MNTVLPISIPGPGVDRRAQAGFMLVEVIVGMAIIGIVFVSLYAGLSSGVALIEMTRENLRATQILVEKMETARLFTWEQVTNGTSLPGVFEENYYPSVNGRARGVAYHGSLVISNVNLGTDYDEGLRLLVVAVRWTNGQIPRYREIQTLVARDGLQNYIF